MENDILIRDARESDVPFIVESQISMAWETEQYVLKREKISAGVEAVFRDGAKGKYYVAEVGGKIAGCLLTTPEWSDWRNKWVLWIQSVFVPEPYRKLGVFRALYLHVKTIAGQRPDVAGIRLYVDKTNRRACSVYDAVGMNGEHYQLYEWMKE